MITSNWYNKLVFTLEDVRYGGVLKEEPFVEVFVRISNHADIKQAILGMSGVVSYITIEEH